MLNNESATTIHTSCISFRHLRPTKKSGFLMSPASTFYYAFTTSKSKHKHKQIPEAMFTCNNIVYALQTDITIMILCLMQKFHYIDDMVFLMQI